MHTRQVIVIGLDGATFDIIDPLVERGFLPNIHKLMRNGSYGVLESTIPASTIPAWTSFMTGKNPAKYGVFDFFKSDGANRSIIDRRDIKAVTIWDVLSAVGRRSIVVNVPGTYPPKRIEGIIVSGMLTRTGGDFASPKEIETFLHECVGRYRVNENSELWNRGEKDSLLKDVYDLTTKQKKAFLALLKKYPWSFAMIMFRGTDLIQHKLWKYMDEIERFYQFMDGIIGEIHEAFPGATFIIMSDHGFQPQFKSFHINKWLIDNGFMVVKKGTEGEAERRQAIMRLADREETTATHSVTPIQRALRKLGLARNTLVNFMPAPVWDFLKAALPERVKSVLPVASYEVDWERTMVSGFQFFGAETKALNINKTMTQADRERVREEIIKGLDSLRDPEDGKKVFDRIYTREELFSGPYLDQAPDIIITLREGYNITNAFFASRYITEVDIPRGCHHRDGILIACGDDIAPGTRIGNCSILDLCPTILQYMDAPVPNDVDGIVLRGMFSKDSAPYKRPVQFQEFQVCQERDYETGEYRDAEVEDRLRALGYL